VLTGVVALLFDEFVVFEVKEVVILLAVPISHEYMRLFNDMSRLSTT